MRPQLNHTIVAASDKRASAAFYADVLGFGEVIDAGYFVEVETGNGVLLAFSDDDRGVIQPQHYAFLVTEQQFDEIFERIRQRGLDTWADPGCSRPGEINTNDGGRGVYFPDPDGHLLEILTRPYGSGPRSS